MIIRVMQKMKYDEKFVGDFESSFPPSIGDTFWYHTNGPYTVVDRTIIYKRADDPYYDILLLVEEEPKHV